MPSYPTLTGYKVQRPWGWDREYKNAHNDMAHGFRYSRNHRATPLMRFELEYPSLSDVDLPTLRDFFIARKGSYETFDFTDPETTTNYPNCRFGQDDFEVRHLGPNQNAVTLIVQEFHV